MILGRRQTEGLDAGVVAQIEASVDHRTDTQTGAEGVAEDVLILLFAAQFSHTLVDLGQSTGHSLAEGEEVAIVVDKHGQAEFLLQERAEGHTVAETREVGQEAAYDAVGIVGRAGEGKRDSHRLLVEQVDDGLEAVDHRLEAQLQIVGTRGDGHGVNYKFASAHGAEHKVCAPGIEGNHNSVVKMIHGIILIRN